MNRDQAYQQIKRFVQSERAWREKVFARQPDQLAQKLAGCDKTLEALEELRKLTVIKQPTLFERRKDS